MSTVDGKYNVGWNDHANNFSITFGDLLEQKELIDVTLAGDGYFFNAHRLILSALSPYFRHIFTQMPANQQAYVFMKDVHKETLHNLMTFIYRGEVNVSHGNLEDFLNTAKALKIKGLTHECVPHAFECQKSTSGGSTLPYNGHQYQSSHTVHGSANVKSVHNLAYESNFNRNYSTDADQQQINFECIDDNNALNGNDHEITNTHIELDAYDHGIVNVNTILDQKFNKHNDDWMADHDGNAIGENMPKTNVHQPKRIKRMNDIGDYNIVADIRTNEFGRQNLYYNGYKMYRHANGSSTQWLCIRRTSIDKCRASIRTIEVNGVVMMNIINAVHTHQP